MNHYTFFKKEIIARSSSLNLFNVIFKVSHELLTLLDV